MKYVYGKNRIYCYLGYIEKFEIFLPVIDYIWKTDPFYPLKLLQVSSETLVEVNAAQ